MNGQAGTVTARLGWRRKSRRGLWLLVLVVLGIIGYTSYVHWWLHHPERLIRSAQASHAEGARLLGSDPRQAAIRFEEAQLQAMSALDHLERRRRARPSLEANPEPRLRLEGQAYWIKARSICDLAYARSSADGKPLAETVNSADGRRLRDPLRIPDDPARQEACRALRAAAVRLPDHLEVQQEALRVELPFSPPAWPLLQHLAENILKLDARDLRARQVLARLEFEQPIMDTGNPERPSAASPPATRNRERMLKALEHLAVIREQEKKEGIRWRTLYLEARVYHWLVAYYRTPTRGRPQDSALAEKELDRLLLDEETGVFALARQPGRLDNLSPMDLEGALGILTLAQERVLEAARKQKQDPRAAESLRKAQQAHLSACRRLLGQDLAPAQRAEVADRALLAMQRAQPLLAPLAPEWQVLMEEARALMAAAREKKVHHPAPYARLTQLLILDSELAAKERDPVRAQARRRQALETAAEGVELARQNNVPASQAAQLNELLARLKVAAGEKPDHVAQELDRLRQANPRSGTALALLLAGASDAREGKLEKAYASLVKAREAAGSSAGLRIHLVLAQVCLDLGKPDEALASLRELERFYQAYQQQESSDRSWALQFVGAPEDFRLLQVRTLLYCALKKTAAAEVRALEEEARRLMSSLPVNGRHAREAHQALVEYYQAAGALDRARIELAWLRRDFPDRPEVLRLEIACLARQGLIQQADDRLRQFLEAHPGDREARLLRAEWLSASGRNAEAVWALEGFDDAERDDRHQRMLALVYLRQGERRRGQELLRALPADAAVDALLVRVSDSPAEAARLLEEAAERHPRESSFRYARAAMAYHQGRFEEAALGFFDSLEVTRLRRHARHGLQASLVSLAAASPEQARRLTESMLDRLPAEVCILVPHALACLLLDDLGHPSQVLSDRRNMQWALGALDQLWRQARDGQRGPWTQAQFWHAAGRPDLARPFAQEVLDGDPGHAPARMLLARTALELDDPILLEDARRQLAAMPRGGAEIDLLLAQVLRQLGRGAEAAAVYQALIDRSETAAYAPLAALLEAEGDQQGQREVILRWREAAPADAAAAQALVGMLARSGKLDEARWAANSFLQEELCRQSNGLVQAQLLMAEAFSQAGQWHEAEARLRELLAADPSLEPARLLRAGIYLERMRQEAQPLLRHAWKHRARGLYAELVERQGPGWDIAANNLAWLLAREFQEPEAALPLVRRLRRGRYGDQPVSGGRMTPEILDTIGLVYRQLDQPAIYAEMRDLFQEAAARYTRDPRIHFYLAAAHAGLGDTSRAQAALTRTLELAAPDAHNPLSPAEREAVLHEARLELQKLKARAAAQSE